MIPSGVNRRTGGCSRTGWVGVVVMAIAGCATEHVQPVPLATWSMKEQEGKTIGVAAMRAPDFLSGLPAGGSIVHFVAAAKEGYDIVRAHHLTDPSLWIGGRLATAMAQQYGLVVRTPVAVSSPGESASHWDTDFTIEVETTKWGTSADMSGQQALFNVALILRNFHGRVMASGSCEYEPRPSDAHSHDELVAKNAAMLKFVLEKAAQSCANTLARQVLHQRLPEDTTDATGARTYVPLPPETWPAAAIVTPPPRPSSSTPYP
jgi:hypothetical protein